MPPPYLLCSQGDKKEKFWKTKVHIFLELINKNFQVGKPSGAADLKLGLATAPVIFAAEKHPNLKLLMQRKFSNPGDVELAFQVF